RDPSPDPHAAGGGAKQDTRIRVVDEVPVQHPVERVELAGEEEYVVVVGGTRLFEQIHAPGVGETAYQVREGVTVEVLHREPAGRRLELVMRLVTENEPDPVRALPGGHGPP